MNDYKNDQAYRQYQDQIIQKLRQPRHFTYLTANVVSGDKLAVETYCRDFIDTLTGPQLPKIRQKLYQDVPKIITEYIRYSISQNKN